MAPVGRDPTGPAGFRFGVEFRTRWGLGPNGWVMTPVGRNPRASVGVATQTQGVAGVSSGFTGFYRAFVDIFD